jgi:hypothetical protein
VIYGPVALAIPLVLLPRRSGGVASRRWISTLTVVAAAIAVTGTSGARWSVGLQVNEVAASATTDRINRALGFLTGRYNDAGSRTTRWSQALNIADEYSVIEIAFGRGTRSYYAAPEFMRSDGSQDTPHNFLLAAAFTVYWIVTASISGEEFFGSKHFVAFGVIYCAMWRNGDEDGVGPDRRHLTASGVA